MTKEKVKRQKLKVKSCTALRSLPTSKEVLFLHIVIPILQNGVRNLMTHNGKQESGTRMTRKKAKVKSKKLHRSSKSPDFEGSAFPSFCHFNPELRGSDLMAHNGKQESGTRMTRKKAKVKSKKLYRSSKSPDFKGSAFPSCCHSDTPDHEHSGRGEESHGPQRKTGIKKQEPGWQGKRKKAKVKSLKSYEC